MLIPGQVTLCLKKKIYNILRKNAMICIWKITLFSIKSQEVNKLAF